MDEHNEALEVSDQEVADAWGEDESTPTVAETDDLGRATNEETPPAVDNPPPADKPAEKPVEGKKADQPEDSFTLKHLDETKVVNREEAVALAQKGMDYDRVRTERDQLRQFRQDADPALALVKSYAEKNGMDVSAYIDYCRKQELIAQGINETTAAAQVEVEKQQAVINTKNAEAEAERQKAEREQQEEQRKGEERTKDMNTFLSAYPAVKPDDIPAEVWERVAKGESLMGAYTMHRNKELEAQIAAERQNKQNRHRSPGSLSASMEGSKRDEIDSVWYRDD